MVSNDDSKAGRNPLPRGLWSLVVYVLLVGLPLAGVASILYWGEGLEAPASVKGRWQVEFEGMAAEAGECAAGLSGAMALTIVQSGPDLRLTLGDATGTTLAGRVDGLLLTAGKPASGLALNGTLDRLSQSTRMSGTATAAECQQPISWSATRLPTAE